MAKLPPRVVSGKSKKQPDKPSRRTTDASGDAPVSQTAAARHFGLGLMGMGALAMVLPLFGLQLRQLGNNGQFTPVVGVILFLIGGVTFAVSFSKTSTSLANLAAKGVLWMIIGAFALVMLAGVAMLIIFALH